MARALEDPFVHPPNDLPAQAMQSAFNQRLISSMDALRVPADAEAAVARQQRAASSSAAASGSASWGAAAVPDLDDPALWGKYARLEPKDVRRAATELLHQWRLGAFAGSRFNSVLRRRQRALSTGVSAQNVPNPTPKARHDQYGEAPTLELIGSRADSRRA